MTPPLRAPLPPTIRCAYCRGTHATMTALEACAAVVIAREVEEYQRDEADRKWVEAQGGGDLLQMLKQAMRLTDKRVQETRDLAEQDRASGHLTEFWYMRLGALCDLIDELGAARAGASREGEPRRDLTSAGETAAGKLRNALQVLQGAPGRKLYELCDDVVRAAELIHEVVSELEGTK